jgi:hypothetical protein
MQHWQDADLAHDFAFRGLLERDPRRRASSAGTLPDHW